MSRRIRLKSGETVSMPGARVSMQTQRLLKTAGDAAVGGVRETLEECVKRAKRDHPNWKSRTNTAEDSIAVGEVKEGKNGVEGEWGSYGRDAWYFIFLEVGTGKIRGDDTLRRAADAEYPKLAGRIRARMNDDG